MHTQRGKKTHWWKNRTKRHSLVKMMNWARCYNKADATWHILWGLSSCAFLFPSEIRAAAEISLILTKHLCHIINTSQSCLSPRKDSDSSVLRFILSLYSAERSHTFLFCICSFACFEGLFSSGLLCSAQLINTEVLFTPSFGLYWFLGWTHYSYCSSVPFILFQLASTKRL